MYLISSKSNEDNLEYVRESWELDGSLLRQGNGEIANDGEVDDEIGNEFVINIPIGTNISKDANEEVIRNLGWYLDGRLVIGTDRPRVGDFPWNNLPGNSDIQIPRVWAKLA